MAARFNTQLADQSTDRLSRMEPLSVIIITFNEEVNIRRTLSRLAWCDEVVVIDSFSTDKTLEICESFGCKVIQHGFEGYGKQKQFALSQAKNNWILSLDADEVPSDELVTSIQDAMQKPHDCQAYFISRSMVFQGRAFLYGSESSRYILRLFNKQHGQFTADNVHEKIVIDGASKRLKGNLLHYTSSSIHNAVEKLNSYTTLGAEIAFNNGKRKNFLMILLGAGWSFVASYFFQLNFMNGVEGFYWSSFNSYSHFIKYSKLQQMQRNSS